MSLEQKKQKQEPTEGKIIFCLSPNWPASRVGLTSASVRQVQNSGKGFWVAQTLLQLRPIKSSVGDLLHEEALGKSDLMPQSALVGTGSPEQK